MMRYPGDLLAHLGSFVALASAAGSRGPYERAARELGVDASVLRRRMQTLATWAGAPLFEGRGSSLRLTTAGARTRTQAVRALDATAEIPLAAADDAGPLRIACTGTILAEILPPALRAVREAHPRLSFRVRRGGAELSRTWLERCEIDFAVLRATEQPEGVASLRVGHDRLWLALPEGKARRPLAQIAREPLVGYGPQSSTMRRVMQVMGPLGASPWIEVDGKNAALAYVAHGLGVAFVSVLAGQRPERRGVQLVDVTASFPRVAFWLVWAPDAAISGWRATFVEHVKRTAHDPLSKSRDRRPSS